MCIYIASRTPHAVEVHGPALHSCVVIIVKSLRSHLRPGKRPASATRAWAAAGVCVVEARRPRAASGPASGGCKGEECTQGKGRKGPSPASARVRYFAPRRSKKSFTRVSVWPRKMQGAQPDGKPLDLLAKRFEQARTSYAIG